MHKQCDLQFKGTLVKNIIPITIMGSVENEDHQGKTLDNKIIFTWDAPDTDLGEYPTGRVPIRQI
jgi:hypothetical protein